MRPVKQKTQAFAAFLGVSGFLRDVVGGCCIRTTSLAGSTVRCDAKLPRLLPKALRFSSNRTPVEIPTAHAKEPRRFRCGSPEYADFPEASGCRRCPNRP